MKKLTKILQEIEIKKPKEIDQIKFHLSKLVQICDKMIEEKKFPENWDIEEDFSQWQDQLEYFEEIKNFDFEKNPEL